MEVSVTMATPPESLGTFTTWHVYVWLGAVQAATAYIVTSGGQRVCVTYFASRDPGRRRRPRKTQLASDAAWVGIPQDELLTEVFRAAAIAAGAEFEVVA